MEKLITNYALDDTGVTTLRMLANILTIKDTRSTGTPFNLLLTFDDEQEANRFAMCPKSGLEISLLMEVSISLRSRRWKNSLKRNLLLLIIFVLGMVHVNSLIVALDTACGLEIVPRRILEKCLSA